MVANVYLPCIIFSHAHLQNLLVFLSVASVKPKSSYVINSGLVYEYGDADN
jgi:hypothetical protein